MQGAKQHATHPHGCCWCRLILPLLLLQAGTSGEAAP